MRSSEKQAITPARYDEGTIATNHNTATGERGYHNITQCHWEHFFCYNSSQLGQIVIYLSIIDNLATQLTL